MEILLTPKEVAERLAVTEGQLAQMRFRGNGPVFRRITPRCIRYSSADIDRFIAGIAFSRTDQSTVAS